MILTKLTGCTAQVIHQYITRDPGLPCQNPTLSYWQHILHPLANTRSASLPDEVDIAVIGSGITGASVTKTLLEKLPSSRIVVLEARSLCSGATGRNGGQLATNAGESYAESREKFGSDMAGKIAEFTLKTCDRMREVIAQYAPEESEYRDITKVRAFLDENSFRAMEESIKLMEADHPTLRGIYQIIDGRTLLEVSKSTILIWREKQAVLTFAFPETWRSRSCWRCHATCWSNVAISISNQGF